MISQKGINPYQILKNFFGLDFNDNNFRGQFRKKLNEITPKYKPDLCLCYDMTLDVNGQFYSRDGEYYFPFEKNQFYHAQRGNLEKIKEILNTNEEENLLSKKDYLKRTILYIAARNGYYDLVKYLIEIGADINEIQSTGSTPLHAASYFGHESVVKLLLENGSNPYIKNSYNIYPVQEAYNDKIKNLIISYLDDKIFGLYFDLLEEGLVTHCLPIIKDGKIICYKFKCKSDFNHKYNKYFSVVAWHGTKYKNLKSIIERGLQPSGAKISDNTIISPEQNHIPLDTTAFGISNFAGGIFVSPSIAYSALPTYAEEIISNNNSWLCIVEVRVRNGAFIEIPSTCHRDKVPKGEPLNVEFRVEKSEYLFVTSVVFLSKEFINNIEEYCETEFICESYNERMLTSESYWD